MKRLCQTATFAAAPKPRGCGVTWIEFPASYRLLGLTCAGAVDFGSTDEARPTVARAVGTHLVHASKDPPAPMREAILVPKKCPIRSVAGPDGKSAALGLLPEPIVIAASVPAPRA